MRRALAILFALESDEATQNGGLGVTRIAELVRREKSQVSRSLKVLHEAGLVDRDPHTRAFRVGWRVFTMATRAGEARLLDEGRRVLRGLVGALGERAHLSVLQQADVLTVMSESPAHTVQAAGWVGRTTPVYCTSAGRALLLDHEPSELAALLDGVDFDRGTAKAPRDVEELYERIVSARPSGFALVDEEFEPALVGAAAPVRDFQGRIVAALNVSAPKFRLRRRLRPAGEAVKAAAEELSRAVGWRTDANSTRPLARDARP